MKKQFTILLILIFILGLTPINFSNAITQNQIDAEVQIVCTDGSGSWFSGSGTIIDPKGIILTNRHVIEGAYMNTCFIGFIESINQEPNFGTEDNPNLAEIKYQTISNDMDAAILYLDNPTNKTYPYINIWDSNSDSLQFGDKVEAIGFPSIGGSTITYTSGDFSGFGSSSYGTQNYIKATVSINHGNSGGATYNLKGEFMGIPTFVIQDITNINYILSVNSIKNWLANTLGSGYQKQITEEEPIIEETTPAILQDITPPDLSKISLQFYDCGEYFPERDSAGNTQHYPTVNGVMGNALTILKSEQCIPIPYDSNKKYDIDPQTLYVKLILNDNVKNDIYTMADWWSKAPLERPLEVQTVSKGSAINLTYYNGFFKPRPNINAGEGFYYYSLQVSDKSGNFSDTKIWMYNYNLSGEIDDSMIDYNFSKKQAGKILIQVESKGKAYYVYPDDIKRYYLGRPADAFNVMRKLGLGATHNFISSYTYYPNHVLGKILLDVEKSGEAYYIYPEDKKAYYLGRPADAFKIMRELGLGITNSDIRKIDVGEVN